MEQDDTLSPSYHYQRPASPNRLGLQSSLRSSLTTTATVPTRQRVDPAVTDSATARTDTGAEHKTASADEKYPRKYKDRARRSDSTMTIDSPNFFGTSSGELEQMMMAAWPRDDDWLNKPTSQPEELSHHSQTQQGSPVSPEWSPSSTMSAWSPHTAWLSTAMTGQCTDDCFVIHCDDPGHREEGGCAEAGCAADAGCGDAECAGDAVPCDAACEEAANIFCTDSRCTDNTHCDECCEYSWLPPDGAGDFAINYQTPLESPAIPNTPDDLPVAHRDHLPNNIPGAPVLDSGFVVAAMRDPTARRQLLDIYMKNMYPDPVQRLQFSYAVTDPFSLSSSPVPNTLVTPLTPPMYYTDPTGVTRILRPVDLRPDPARGLPGILSRDLPRGHMLEGIEYPCMARLELEEAEEGDARGRKRSRDPPHGQYHAHDFSGQGHSHAHETSHAHQHFPGHAPSLERQDPHDHDGRHPAKRARASEDTPLEPSAFAPLRMPPHLARHPALAAPKHLRGLRSTDLPHTHIFEGIELPCISRVELEVREDFGLDSGVPSDGEDGHAPEDRGDPITSSGHRSPESVHGGSSKDLKSNETQRLLDDLAQHQAYQSSERLRGLRTDDFSHHHPLAGLRMPSTTPLNLGMGFGQELSMAKDGFPHQTTSSTHNRTPTATSPSAPAPAPSTARCMWAGCERAFVSVQALAEHVNTEHLVLATPAEPASAPVCQWNDCAAQPSWQAQSAAFSANAFPFAMESQRQQLADHFLQHHLGVSQAHASRLLTEDARSRSSRSPSGERSGSTEDEDTAHAHEAGEHDCATSAHVCQWRGCAATFDSCASLTEHLDKIHVVGGRSRYDCFWGTCERNGERGFSSKQKICRHLQTHTGHRPFTCSECGQHFSEAATLAQHMRRHTRERPYACDHPGCGKAFAIMGALTIHKRTHNGDKPFKCGVCGKAFAESSNLSKHQRTHTGLRPFACGHPGCGKAFARVDQLNRHMNVHNRQQKDGQASTSSA